MAIEELMMYSLVTKRSDSAEKIFLSTHTLVQQGFSNRASSDWQHEYLIWALELLDDAFTREVRAQSPASYGKECQVYTQHILELNARLHEYKPHPAKVQTFISLSGKCAG